jgi:transposase, IS30 family
MVLLSRSEVCVVGRERRYRWLSPPERERVAARLGAGIGLRVVAEEFATSYTTVRRVRDEAVLARRRVGRSPRRLSFEERERISRGIAAGESDSEIARALGRDRSTVGREIRGAGSQRRFYRALRGQRRAVLRSRRPKPTKLCGSPRLLEVVVAGLERRLSPRQISARLRLEYPDDPGMRISHETIYQSLYVQSRGELRRQLTASLRTARTKRKPHGTVERRGKIPGMVSISERPPEVADRAVPGHWEADLLVGGYRRSFVLTLVERHTRYVLLARLGGDRRPQNVVKALTDRVAQMPAQLMLSMTFDQGREFAYHQRFSQNTGVRVYFCDPRSPWQRGSNENTNGLLRQYLPKRSDLAVHSQIALDRIAAELNDRPRKTLEWLTPAEKMSQLLLQ